MAHPSENILGSDTSLRRQIFRQINNQMINPTVTLAIPCARQWKLLHALLWNYITLSGTASSSPGQSALSLPHKTSSVQPLQPNVSLYSPLRCLCQRLQTTAFYVSLYVLYVCLCGFYVLCVGHLRLYISPPRLCAASSSTFPPLWHVFFSLRLKSLVELPLTATDL